MDLTTLGAAACCGGLLGAAIGFVVGRRGGRGEPEAAPDWKLRLRARDRDLEAAEARAADVAVELQEASAALVRANRRIAELEGTAATVDGPADASADGEVDPAVPGDDLTLVPGLGPGDAALLTASGIVSFESLAQVCSDGAVVPETVAEHLADRLSGWADDARRLARLSRERPG
jgi:predicted flap endonuclease-1-like 5' DNA nuclease